MGVVMSQSSTVTSKVLALLLLAITSSACGRVALTPQLHQEGELRAFVIGVASKSSARAADESELDGPSGSRLVRPSTDDSSIAEARATRSGWAASEAR